jgi:SNF2 family DNA or RNA helicase
MNNWDIMSHHVRMGFAVPAGTKDASEHMLRFRVVLEALPGVKLKRGLWHVPLNAIDVVLAAADEHAMHVTAAAWSEDPKPPVTWAEAEAALAAGGMRPEYLGAWPTPYQQEAVLFGWNLDGCHLWHSTGAGKTWSGVALSLREPGPALVITRSAAKIQLAREIERFVDTRAYVVRAASSVKTQMTVDGMTWQQFFASQMPKLGKAKAVADEWKKRKKTSGVKVNVLSQTMKDYLRERKRDGRKPFVVIGWESLTDHLDDLRELNPAVLVLDEMHMGKGRKRWDAIQLAPLPEDPEEAKKIVKEQVAEARKKGGFIRENQEAPQMPVERVMLLPVINRASAAALIARNTKKRIALTATPIADRPRDLWAQLDTVEPNAHGNKTDWLTRYCDLKPGTYGGMDDTGSSNMDELKARLDRITHIVPAQEAHKHLLHMKRRQSVYVAPEDQCAPSAGFGKEMTAAKKRGPSAVLECRIARAASKKRKAVIDLVDDHVGSGHKVVLFTARRRDCDELGDRIRKARMGKATKVDVWSAHGDMPVELRQEIVDEYMAHPGPCVLVGTMQAFGQSINLDDTDAAFMVMLPYTPEMLRQAEGRFVRLSMKRAVVIYYVLAEGTVDEHIASILIDKLPAVEDIADDQELGAARPVLAGIDAHETEEDFVSAVLEALDE